MASSSSSSTRSYVYDVFLSFRGEDTRKTFVDHLYSALEQRHIRTYKDDITLPRGESVGPALLNYGRKQLVADRNISGWDLRTNGLIVMPVFYDVDPSDVRKQKGDFGKAFSKQEMKNVNKSWRKLFAKQEVEDTTKVESWKKALVDASNISGWEPKNVANGHESKVIKKIVDTIFGGLFSLNSDIDEGLVGMRARLQDLISQLEIGSGGVRMVGIWGLGGGGKTTLANSVYMEIIHHFKCHCIIENIREESRKSGLKKLQGDILSVLYKTKIEVYSVAEGRRKIKSMLCHSNVLVILDDVDDRDQLEALAGSPNWFGDGSRIIITTRDEHLLRKHKVDHVFPVRLLSHDEAIRLFNSHAYNEEKHIKDYEKLSLQVVSYADGLPLALKVLGSFLYDKDAKEWMSTMDRLRDIPESEIVDKLKISYDGLKPVEKELFLDIACFFRGEWKRDTMEIFDACGFHPEIGIKVLIQKSLITIDPNERFGMHDLIQEMGHYIVRREHPNNPERHSRVWNHEEVSNMCFGDATVENEAIDVGGLIDLPLYEDPMPDREPKTPKPQPETEPRRRHEAAFPNPHHTHTCIKRLKKNRSPSPQPRPRKEGGVFERLGRKEPVTSARSDSHRRSPQAQRTDVETRRRQQRQTPSRATSQYSESEDSEGGHWKSRSRRQKSNTHEDDLYQPWTCEERNPFNTADRNFSLPRTRMPSHVKTYDGSGDPEDHLKLFQSAARTEGWAMPTWCHMFNSTLTGNARVWFDKLPKESIDSYEDLRTAFRENYLQQTKHIKDPVEIHHIKQKDGESTEDFMERYKAEVLDVEGAPECMKKRPDLCNERNAPGINQASIYEKGKITPPQKKIGGTKCIE
ncbi:Toll/interleukin-1 receptor domain-containing protein [Tanacetum coccineum]